jgi:alkylated DNA repair protein alkB family protein 8
MIAEHFNHTRFAAWPRVKNWIDRLEDGSIVYDIGCGNGKYFNNDRHFMLGCDTSINLLEHALQRNRVSLVAADVLNLPIRA